VRKGDGKKRKKRRGNRRGDGKDEIEREHREPVRKSWLTAV
jgi:hypothetical protein